MGKGLEVGPSRGPADMAGVTLGPETTEPPGGSSWLHHGGLGLSVQPRTPKSCSLFQGWREAPWSRS